MKKIFALIGVNLYLILFCSSAAAQDFKTVRDGIEYAELTRQIDNAPVKMNMLRLDLTKVRLDVVHALDAAIGTETTSSMAIRHGAFAAINGGFFRLDKSIFAGDAAGTLMINRKLLSESFDSGNTAFGRINLMISNDRRQTSVFIERMKIKNLVITKNKIFSVGTNRERGENDIVIYTKSFSDTTQTNNNGIEFIVKNNRVVKVFDEVGNIQIPVNGYVISVSGSSRDEALKFLRVNTKAQISFAVETTTGLLPNLHNKSKFLSKSEDITNGVPQLIKNGVIEITWQEEKASKSFYETKHPRTAVAKLKDGKFLMVTVDGRSEASGGIGLEDLAKILLELGATDAMNLDGGGSTTMFLDGKVVNNPSDKEGERRVGDAILVTPRK